MRLADASKLALELNIWIKTGIDPRTQAPGQQRKQVQNSHRPFAQIGFTSTLASRPEPG